MSAEPVDVPGAFDGGDAPRRWRLPSARQALPILGVTATEAVSRLLSFLFYLVAARKLTPDGFGVMRYTIVLAGVAFALSQVVTVTTMRELGSARNDEPRTRQILGSAVTMAGGLWILTAIGCVVADRLGWTGSADLLGLEAVLLGRAAFELYYAIGLGLGGVRRIAIVYAGGSLVQLVLFTGYAELWNAEERVALLIFAGSSILPVLFCEAVRPVLRRRSLRISGVEIRRLVALAAPLVVGQLFYQAWNSADLVWVEATLGPTQVGYYGAARNLTQLFIVLPYGVNGVLVPRLAQLRARQQDHDAYRLAIAAVGSVMALSAALAAVVIAFRGPLVRILFGEAYAPMASPLLVLALGMVLYSGFLCLAWSAVGWGRPGVYGTGIAVAAIVEIAFLALAPGERATTAAWSSAVSGGAALVATGIVIALRPLERSSRQDGGPDGGTAAGPPSADPGSQP